MLVVITTGLASCEEPFAALPCDGAWSISFTLPPALQTPGTYPLFPDLNGGASESFGPGPDCGFGGGTLEGNLDLQLVDATRVVGAITADDPIVDFDPNVAFDAMRCP